ncbi:MAG TPA: hypothetical protein ENK50_12335, partial [Sedimenticola sp.]|nr:hypothetical protein [Sedimenticola sp.]
MKVIKRKNTQRNLKACLLLAMAACLPSGSVAAEEVTVNAGDLDGLKSAFEQRGWRVEETAEKDLILRPPYGEPAVQDAGDTEGGASRISATDLAGLQQRLQATGWEVERAADGSLLVHRPDETPA